MNTVLLFAALISAPMSGPKHANQSADVAAIRAAHSKLLDALNSKNAGVVKSLFTKDFTQTAYGTTFNRDQAVAQMTQGPAATKVEWSIGGIKVSGDKAAYTSNFKFETVSAKSAGKPAKVSGGGVQKLQLVKEGGKWLYRHLEVLSK